MSVVLNKSTIGWSSNLTQVENQVKGLIAAAEANIERLGAQIRELETLRQKERTVLATLRRMITPIGKLPTELLVEIFKLAVQTPLLRDPPDANRLYDGEYREALRKVLCLAHVSPYWRHIIHNTPQLWAEGVLDFRCNREPKDPYLVELKAMLNRSAPHKISVSLHTGNRYLENVVPSVFTATVARWRTLECRLQIFPSFEQLPSENFASLERLHLSGLWSQTAPITVFLSSPLTHFTLRCEAGTVKLFQLPWGQLTHIEILDESMSGCRSVLLQGHNLISATLHTSLKWDSDLASAHSPVVVLPFLETLNFTVWNCKTVPVDGLEVLFMPLSLPALKTLNIEFYAEEEESWPTKVFFDFLDRAHKLERIKFTYSSIYAEDLVSLLQHTPALKTFELLGCWLCMQDDIFFTALRYDEADLTPLVPKLESLNFENVGEIREGPFEQAICSRWWQDDGRVLADGSLPRVSRLKDIQIAPSDMEEDMLSAGLKVRMQKLVEQGLNLDLTVGFLSN
ncbi:hypothetical protein R3P38DRAFT_2615088 [Favolaschia claudopus]|uniref:F-box domain-containing protein n=1 Tax=Favolaschia claudopus TaxID=2862362 RepID=A0AAW0CH93_9AGAR